MASLAASVISPDDAVATLKFLVPGFICLKVIYLLAFRIRRTDLEWVIWSLIASAPINVAAGLMHPEDDFTHLVIAILTAAAAGGLVAAAWQVLMKRFPRVRDWISPTAWDAVLSQSSWVEITTLDHMLYSGQTSITADSAQSERLDIYLTAPAWSKDRKSWDELTDVAGLLLDSSQIASVRVMTPAPDKPKERPKPSPPVKALPESEGLSDQVANATD